MKKIFELLIEIERKGQYYRLIVTPEHVDVKLYSTDRLDTQESNYAFKNTEEDLCGLEYSLQLYLQKL